MEGDLKVWWIPQIPLVDGDKPFYINVKSPQEGKNMLDALARYDIYQLEHNIKPDYCNVGGLSIENDNKEWDEWENSEMESIDEVEFE